MDSPAALDSHLGYWLRLVSNHVSQGFARKVEARGVTVAEWVMLRALHDRAEVAPSMVAEALGMTRGTVSKLVDRLAVKRLVSKAQAGGDKRFQQIALTEAGRALVPELAALADANDAEFFGGLDEAERAALAATLRAIARRGGIRETPID